MPIPGRPASLSTVSLKPKQSSTAILRRSKTSTRWTTQNGENLKPRRGRPAPLCSLSASSFEAACSAANLQSVIQPSNSENNMLSIELMALMAIIIGASDFITVGLRLYTLYWASKLPSIQVSIHKIKNGLRPFRLWKTSTSGWPCGQDG